jgi:methylase of polypeptide subunit release factors
MAGEDFRWLRRFSQAAADYLTAGGRCLLVLADSTDLKTVLNIFKKDGWGMRRLATRDVLVERLFIVALQRPR